MFDSPRLLSRLEFSLWRYSLPLAGRLTVQTPDSPSRREGALLVLQAEYGGAEAIGVGEIAPLPGLHAETLAQAEAQTCSAVAEAFGAAFQEAAAFAELCSGAFLEKTPLFPSVRCGAEMALWSLWARLREEKERIVFPEGSQSSARAQAVNALITGDGEVEIVRRAEEAVRAGYRTLKIKVGRGDWTREAASARAVWGALKNAVALRLDANRSWSLDDAARFGEAVADCGVEYIEEPLRNAEDIPLFFQETGVKVALDETLYAPDENKRRSRFDVPDEALAAYILKPAAIGGLRQSSALAREAAKRGLNAVASSVFESGVALGFYAALQSSWNEGREVACGLDTFQTLGDDVVSPRFRAERGLALLPDAFDNAANVRFEILECAFRRDVVSPSARAQGA